MTDLQNKVVVITGAANGLGRALAMEFYKHGSHLALIDKDKSSLEKILKSFQRTSQKVTIHIADVSDEESIKIAKNEILHSHHHIDILINNAGISMSMFFENTELSDFRNIIETNFWGTINCTKYFLDEVKKSKDGRIVNIISDFALMGFPGKTAYASSKSAVMGFTNSLKTELADTNVKVCLVIPPPLDTGLINSGMHINESKKKNESEFIKKHGMPLDKAARKIVSQIKNGQYRIVIGTMMRTIDFISRLFPSIIHNIISKNKKRIDFT